ncbi:hypothetical protein Tco_0554677 [Tanacetum coccineum]
MDNPNITMEEYIRLEEEKARRRVFNDTLTSEAMLSCEPMVSSLNNNEIDFRISFDESDDEDCTIFYTAYPNPMDTAYKGLKTKQKRSACAVEAQQQGRYATRVTRASVGYASACRSDACAIDLALIVDVLDATRFGLSLSIVAVLTPGVKTPVRWRVGGVSVRRNDTPEDQRGKQMSSRARSSML